MATELGHEQQALFPDMPVESWRTAEISEVSTNAQHLLRILRRLCRNSGKPYCFPTIAKLTEWLSADRGVASARQVQRYVSELRDHELIRVEKRGQNFYFPASLDDKMSSRMSSPVSSRMSSSPIYRCTISAAALENEHAAAATAQVPKPENLEVAKASAELQAVGVAAPIAATEASRDPQLCIEVAALTRETSERKRLNNPAGFARHAIHFPDEVGFTRDAAGHWQRPGAKAKPPPMTAAEIAALNRKNLKLVGLD